MWLLHPPKSRRRWHVFTWLAAVPALVFVALVQVRGIGDSDPHRLIQPQPQWYRHAVLGPLDEYGKPDFDPEIDELYQDLPQLVEAYEHGWPMPWLHRALGYGGGRWRSMSFTGTKAEALRAISAARWPLTSDIWRVAPVGLAVNLLVAATLIALPMLITESWLRRRGGLGRFKIIDFLAVVLVFATLLGFYRWDQAELEREYQVLAKVFDDKSSTSVVPNYMGPEWLARVVGNPSAVPVLHRYTALGLYSPKLSDQEIRQLSELAYLRHLTLGDESRDIAQLTRFKSFHQLEHIEIYGEEWTDDLRLYISALSQLPQLKKVTLHVAPLREDLAPLQKLPRLTELAFDPAFLSDEALTELRQDLPGVNFQFLDLLPLLRKEREAAYLVRLNHQPSWQCSISTYGSILRWQGVPFTAQNVWPLARTLPEIRELILIDAPLNPGELPELSQFTSLEDLTLDVTEFPNEFMAQLAGREQLNTLRLERRPSSLEPLLHLRNNPPRALLLNFELDDEKLTELREAFGDRLRYTAP